MFSELSNIHQKVKDSINRLQNLTFIKSNKIEKGILFRYNPHQI
jgi:hypothetical protein